MIRRLAPLFIFTIVLEFLEFFVMLYMNRQALDTSFLAMVKTSGILLFTTCVAFLYFMIPYVLYLLFLPKSKQNSKFDKIITLTGFSLFVYVSFFEEMASFIFWEEFSSAFNFIAIDYLFYTKEVFGNLYQAFPLIWYLLAIFAATIITVMVVKKYLFTTIEAPKFGKRLFYTSLYLIACFLIFINVNVDNLEVNNNRVNNELSKEGTYSLFSSFFKNELKYEDFYPTQNEDDNLELLRKDLTSQYSEFYSKKSLKREIDYEKRERKTNVIVIMMESMGAKFLDENRKSGQSLLTPNLSKLIKDSVYFPNSYATGTHSVRGLEAIALGIPPLPGMPIIRRPGNENIYNIGSIFKAKDYDNKWIYGGYGYFDNMNYFFSHNGFEAIDRTKWEKDEVNFANAWGASDEDTFAKIISEADKSYGKEKLFFTLALTLSNHGPLTYPHDKITLPQGVSKHEGGVVYADYAIGKFLEAAKEKPWFDNTIFIFTADHNVARHDNADIVIEDYRIPLIYYAPKILKPHRYEMALSQIDTMPTLLGMLDFEYDSRFYGKDVLRDKYEPRFFISNNQQAGYAKNGYGIILKPVKQYSFHNGKASKQYLQEAIAYYQQASDWRNNLKED